MKANVVVVGWVRPQAVTQHPQIRKCGKTVRSSAPTLFCLQAVAILVTLLLSSGAFAQNGLCPADAQAFWKEFRHAALVGDYGRVADLSQFPFHIRSVLDENDAKEMDRNQFLRVMPQLLRTDAGISVRVTSMRQLLKSHPILTPSFCNPPGNQFRVGVWVFAKTFESWRFTQAFVDD